MSLQYIIDAYNIINHPQFNQHVTKKIKNSQFVLLEFIKVKRPCGSSKNKVTVVFDGYPNSHNGKIEKIDIDIVFSQEETADERIKKLVETSVNPKNLVVVSDDKEIKFFVRSVGGESLSVEKFIQPKATTLRKKEDSFRTELTYSQMQKINQELRKIWLK